MKDPRTILDAIRNKVPPDAKLLVVWQDGAKAPLRCAQANLSLGDVEAWAANLAANARADKMTVR